MREGPVARTARMGAFLFLFLLVFSFEGRGDEGPGDEGGSAESTLVSASAEGDFSAALIMSLFFFWFVKGLQEP